MKKHVGVLEEPGSSPLEGRAREDLQARPAPDEEETAWIEQYRRLWASRFDELDKVVEELMQKEKIDGRKKASVIPLRARTA